MDRLYLAGKEERSRETYHPHRHWTSHFQEAIRDFGASVNIKPKVIYDQINGDTLLYTTMHFQLADQSLCYPKGVLEDVIVRVGQSYIPVDFVVLETGGDIRAPIILGRPFPSTAKAIIYVDSAKICFTINDRKEKFSFKNRILQSPRHQQTPYLPKETTVTKKKKNRRRKNKARHPQEESVHMINTLRS